MAQVTAPQLEGRTSGDEAGRFRKLLVIAAAACIPFLIAHVVLAAAVTPMFAHMYAEAGIAVRAPQSALFALSDRGLLAVVVLACDALFFLVMYLLAHRYRTWLLFVPAAVFALTAASYVQWLYTPLFDSMNIVRWPCGVSIAWACRRRRGVSLLSDKRVEHSGPRRRMRTKAQWAGSSRAKRWAQRGGG